MLVLINMCSRLFDQIVEISKQVLVKLVADIMYPYVAYFPLIPICMILWFLAIRLLHSEDKHQVLYLLRR